MTWYWPHWHCFDGDRLTVKCTGWEGMMHWTGAAEFTPDHPDYALWAWLVDIPHYHRRVHADELPAIRRIWKRARRRARLST